MIPFFTKHFGIKNVSAHRHVCMGASLWSPRSRRSGQQGLDVRGFDDHLCELPSTSSTSPAPCLSIRPQILVFALRRKDSHAHDQRLRRHDRLTGRSKRLSTSILSVGYAMAIVLVCLCRLRPHRWRCFRIDLPSEEGKSYKIIG